MFMYIISHMLKKHSLILSAVIHDDKPSVRVGKAERQESSVIDHISSQFSVFYTMILSTGAAYTVTIESHPHDGCNYSPKYNISCDFSTVIDVLPEGVVVTLNVL